MIEIRTSSTIPTLPAPVLYPAIAKSQCHVMVLWPRKVGYCGAPARYVLQSTEYHEERLSRQSELFCTSMKSNVAGPENALFFKSNKGEGGPSRQAPSDLWKKKPPKPQKSVP